jgi:hypothetical protein
MSEWKDRINTSFCNDPYKTGWVTVDQIINNIKNLRLKRKLRKEAKLNKKNLKK